MSSGELLRQNCINLLINLIGFSLCFAIIYIFFSCFFPRRKNPSKLLTLIVFFVWYLSAIWIDSPLINTCKCIVSFFLVAMIWFDGKWFQKIAFTGILLTIWGLSEMVVSYFFTLLEIDIQLYDYVGSILSQLLILVLLAILCFYKFFGIQKIRILPSKYYIMLSLMPFSNTFIIYRLFIYSIEIKHEYAVYETIICLYIMIVINILIYKLYISLADEMSERKYNAIYAQQLELYGKTVREREMSMAEYRSIRHDMKQHFSSVLNMLEKQNYQTAEEYLKKLVEDNTDHSQICRTENPVVDAIVNAKYSFMKTLGIQCTADIHIPMQLPFEMADMSVLLGNVLDNAIEANNDSVAKKYIKIYMAYDKNILIITVINSYDGTLIRDKTGKILTRKDDQNAHGFGLVSIERIVQKYHGSMVIEETAEEFKIKLIMVDDRP